MIAKICLMAIHYGAFILTWKSIWPVLSVQGLARPVVSVKVIGKLEFEDMLRLDRLSLTLILSVVTYGLHSLRRVSLHALIPDVRQLCEVLEPLWTGIGQ